MVTTKAKRIGQWRNQGLVLSSKEEGYEIYDRYINSTNCEKCGNKYTSTIDRHMDHAHLIDDTFGYFRNVLCQSCNHKRRDRNAKNNVSGYNGISKKIDKNCKQGFYWEFRVCINKKRKTIKTSVDYDKLVEFADNWKIENNY
tara:strand:+ start:83 stop:511 length:429 start_codon:yes stop_codon:yes gene_type:complete